MTKFVNQICYYIQMKNTFKTFLNPLKWIAAIKYHYKQKAYRKSEHDHELHLYSRILLTDMLHWGYFDNPDIDPEEISISKFSEAQYRYAENIAALLGSKDQPVLDVGCGMGGMASMFLDKGYDVELLTPNNSQKKYLHNKFPDISFHHCKYEDFSTNKKYGTVINAESLQYINLEKAFQKTEKILSANGKWIISDYFRLHDSGKNKSGHLLGDFENMVNKMGWIITFREDYTKNVLPTIKLVKLYTDRFIIPLVNFGFQKLDQKKSWLYYMLEGTRKGIFRKIDKEMAAIDPDLFVQEKKYMLYVLLQ
jgi:cyclopropane fatty-acyl-phospholipid synthase-like methyltransferase